MTVGVTVRIQINHDQIQNPQLITVAENLTRDNNNKNLPQDYNTFL
jgi:hypothetical protein